MARQQRNVHFVSGGIQRFREIAQRLWRVARSVQEEQAATCRCGQHEPLRSACDARRVGRETHRVVGFHDASDAPAIEHRERRRCKRADQEGNHADPVEGTRSVAANGVVDLEAPAIDASNEIRHPREALIL